MDDDLSIPRTPRVVPPPEHIITGPEMPPTPMLAPMVDPADLVSGEAIIGAIAKADRAQADPLDLARIAYRDNVPADNAKLGRIAKALGTTPAALISAARPTT